MNGIEKIAVAALVILSLFFLPEIEQITDKGYIQRAQAAIDRSAEAAKREPSLDAGRVEAAYAKCVAPINEASEALKLSIRQAEQEASDLAETEEGRAAVIASRLGHEMQWKIDQVNADAGRIKKYCDAVKDALPVIQAHYGANASVELLEHKHEVSWWDTACARISQFSEDELSCERPVTLYAVPGVRASVAIDNQIDCIEQEAQNGNDYEKCFKLEVPVQ